MERTARLWRIGLEGTFLRVVDSAAQFAGWAFVGALEFSFRIVVFVVVFSPRVGFRRDS